MIYTLELERPVTKNGIFVWEKYSIDLDPDKDLKINEDQFEHDAVFMGHLMALYGTAAAYAKGDYEKQKDALDLLEAKLDLQARSETEKFTENLIKNKVRVHPEYISAVERLSNARVQFLLSESWWKSLQKKADLLCSVMYKQGIEQKQYGRL